MLNNLCSIIDRNNGVKFEILLKQLIIFLLLHAWGFVGWKYDVCFFVIYEVWTRKTFREFRNFFNCSEVYCFWKSGMA